MWDIWKEGEPNYFNGEEDSSSYDVRNQKQRIKKADMREENRKTFTSKR